MADLAIKGHETRGREVIKLLEMLGGKERTFGLFNGDAEISWYYIDEDGYIDFKESSLFAGTTNVFTLEEFLEKFPYKVGDWVQYNGAPSCGSVFEVEKMQWEDEKVKYIVKRLEDCGYGNKLKSTAEHLKPYKETTEEKKINQMSIANCDLDEVEIVLGDKFELVNREGKYYAVKKKDQYPKTFEECCDVLRIFYTESTDVGYEFKLLRNLRRLLICRDAYWKISGEQMGLYKPWEPDWTNNYQKKWTINFYQDGVNLTNGPNVHFILAFPTEEMRDDFYENFKDLIEACKELL